MQNMGKSGEFCQDNVVYHESNSIPNKILEIKNAKAKRRSGQVFHGKEGQANSAPVDNSLSLARTESTMGLMPMKGGRYWGRALARYHCSTILD